MLVTKYWPNNYENVVANGAFLQSHCCNDNIKSLIKMNWKQFISLINNAQTCFYFHKCTTLKSRLKQLISGNKTNLT